MYMHFTAVLVGITSSLCYSNYEIFQGFDNDLNNRDTTETVRTNQTTTIYIDTTSSLQDDQNTTVSSANSITKKKMKVRSTCPEELATNIGTYEIPTQKDIVIFTKDLLTTMFEAYERDATSLLMDIKEATKSAATLEKECPYNKQVYKQCVKHISAQTESITKGLVNSLQIEKADVKALTDNTICNLSEMKSNPMSLVKLLAQETVMLKFALPGFLRLIKSCSELCMKYQVKTYANKAFRRITDQELVVKHFLTNKNYVDVIKDSRRGD